MERFVCGTKIISGAGAAESLRELGAKRVLVVTDPFFYENGTAARIGAYTGAETVEIFHQVAPDPGLDLAAAGTARVRDFNPDLIVALGGGSAMDCAKAMKYFSGSGTGFVAIPTTSGSGSEVTDFAILTHDGVKHPLVDESLRPDVAILDGSFLEKLPKRLIADSGFDVLSHALEALAATGSGAITDALARDAFCTVFGKLKRSYDGDVAMRPEIHMAATMAGMAFTQAGLGLCHALAHALGGAFHVPHGRLNAILIPTVLECNAPVAGRKYAELARRAGLGGSVDTIALRNLRSGLVRLRRELELPETLAQAGVNTAELGRKRDAIVAAALADPCCKTNPVPVDAALVGRVLDAVAGHG